MGSGPGAAPTGPALSHEALLAAIPQQDPFRFIDEILSVDEERISAAYRFRAEADFYRGHFPGHPVTPGVLLIEAMAQAGVVAHGIYLMSLGRSDAAAPRGLLTVFTEANVEFVNLVPPGERVVITGRKIFFRHRKLRSAVEMRRADGEIACHGTISGMGASR
ncbi:MAG: beta-hydroxyacyl-ACP dehydratase [Deltaproteobacteria bacterium]|nr:beta-hydroxyacyl-ACP dehydratase [Deltaproteobacteria bacterium]